MFIYDKNSVKLLKIERNIFTDMLEILKVTQKTFTKRISRECTSLAMQLEGTMLSSSTVTTNIK